MLQFALLLLGCALSRYLWDLQRTVSGVAVGITSLGVLFYILILVAGALYTSYPYQTPGSRIIRRIWDKTLSSPVARFSGLSRRLTNLNHLLRPTRPNGRTSRAPNANGHSGPEPTSYILDSDCICRNELPPGAHVPRLCLTHSAVGGWGGCQASFKYRFVLTPGKVGNLCCNTYTLWNHRNIAQRGSIPGCCRAAGRSGQGRWPEQS